VKKSAQYVCKRQEVININLPCLETSKSYQDNATEIFSIPANQDWTPSYCPSEVLPKPSNKND
jgi:hypothetical protein